MRRRSPLHQTSPAAPRPFQRTPSASGKQSKGWTKMSAQHRLRASKIPANASSEYPWKRNVVPAVVSCAPLLSFSLSCPARCCVHVTTAPTHIAPPQPIRPHAQPASSQPASQPPRRLSPEHPRPSTLSRQPAVNCGAVVSLRNEPCTPSPTYLPVYLSAYLATSSPANQPTNQSRMYVRAAATSPKLSPSIPPSARSEAAPAHPHRYVHAYLHTNIPPASLSAVPAYVPNSQPASAAGQSPISCPLENALPAVRRGTARHGTALLLLARQACKGRASEQRVQGLTVWTPERLLADLLVVCRAAGWLHSWLALSRLLVFALAQVKSNQIKSSLSSLSLFSPPGRQIGAQDQGNHHCRRRRHRHRPTQASPGQPSKSIGRRRRRVRSGPVRSGPVRDLTD
ncbi:hypothetical protein IWX49DRAFT_63055 [Phyllosticta citricarpa]|uniref:Uncharacterized protein n=2 Tax=Phyllosticta TaxID=121621 RepID=A0ABR1LDZ6_9PEZI